ncbi:hypothetical protein HK100_006564, partial [Physocladia obscura]
NWGFVNEMPLSLFILCIAWGGAAVLVAVGVLVVAAHVSRHDTRARNNPNLPFSFALSLLNPPPPVHRPFDLAALQRFASKFAYVHPAPLPKDSATSTPAPTLGVLTPPADLSSNSNKTDPDDFPAVFYYERSATGSSFAHFNESGRRADSSLYLEIVESNAQTEFKY